MQSVSNWDSYRRMQVNISKSVPNNEVAGLLAIHYRYLHSKLVRYTEDEDVFNDTFLKLTYNYNPDKDFISQYLYYFNLLKGAYYRDNKVTSWLVTSIEDNPVELPDVLPEEEPIASKQSEDEFLSQLKDAITKPVSNYPILC